MTPKQAALLCLLLAVFLSNLPFFCSSWLAWLSPKAATRSTAGRLVLWLLFYALWIAVTMVLESSSLGKLQPKDWSIWPVSIAFFAVLALPGVTYRYLWQARKKA